MRSLVLYLLLAWAICVPLSLCKQQTAPVLPAIELDENNFDHHVRRFNATFLMIYAPWCGHCKTAMPHFDALFSALEPAYKKKAILIAKVNGDANRSISSRFNIKGYPTFVIYFNSTGAFRQYNGQRTSQAFFKFLSDPLPELRYLLSDASQRRTTTTTRHEDL